MSNTAYKRILQECMISLLSQDKRGQSKFQAKEAAKKEARAAHEPCKPIKGLYSNGTFSTYEKQFRTFLNYLNSINADVKHLQDCRPYVTAYFNTMTEKGLSAWTIHTRMFAFAAVFQCDVKDFGITLLPRRRADIRRGRAEIKTSLRFKNKKNPKYERIREFTTATGTRRGGFGRLEKTDLYEQPGNEVRIHLHEKGGKDRLALVLPEYREFVKNIFASSPGYGPDHRYLFPKGYIPQSMTVHCYRAVYTQKLYELFKAKGLENGFLYHCRREMKGKVFDRRLLHLVSLNLGHNRVGVAVNNYFYKVKPYGNEKDGDPACRG